MAARVTIAEVETIIATVLPDDNITACITSANILVDSYLLDKELTDAQLKNVELWLSAHYVSVQQGLIIKNQLGSQGAANSLEEFAKPKLGMGLDSTQWGQNAMMFDPSGTLSSIKFGIKKAELIAI